MHAVDFIGGNQPILQHSYRIQYEIQSGVGTAETVSSETEILR